MWQYTQTVRYQPKREPSGHAREEYVASVYVRWYTMSKQSGNEWPGLEEGRSRCVQVHRYTMLKQAGPAVRSRLPTMTQRLSPLHAKHVASSYMPPYVRSNRNGANSLR